jgi:hypothetical protein
VKAGADWLVAELLLFFIPAVIAFAIPVFERRAVIRGHVLVIGVAVAASVALTFGTSVMLAELIGLDDTLARSLAPHSLTTPFAITVSTDLGRKPDLAAVFAAVTGVGAIAIGHLILRWSSPPTRLAVGALLGAGANGAGAARAQELGREEGARPSSRGFDGPFIDRGATSTDCCDAQRRCDTEKIGVYIYRVKDLKHVAALHYISSMSKPPNRLGSEGRPPPRRHKKPSSEPTLLPLGLHGGGSFDGFTPGTRRIADSVIS